MLRALVLVCSLFAASSHAAELDEIRSITVTGYAERKVVPDQAIVTVNLNAMAKELSDAKAAHDRKLTKLMGIVRDARIAEKHVRANRSNMQPHYESTHNPTTKRHESRLVGYRVHSNIDITLDDTDKLGNLMQAITDAGFEKQDGKRWGNLMHVRYTISNPREIRDDMLTEALKNAKRKAQNLANASGVQIEGVASIVETGAPSFRPMPVPYMTRGVAMMEAATDAAIAPPAGEQTLTASLTVMYEIESDDD